MDKLYCFQYYTEEHSICRYEYKPELINEYGYHIADKDGDTIHVDKSAIDNPRVATNYETSEKIIYVYTLTDNVNHAMDLIHEAFKITIQSQKKELEELDKMFDAFEEKRTEILRKYPNGKKRQITMEELKER